MKNTMRNIVLWAIALLSTTTFANTLDGKYGSNSIQCVQNLSVYREFYKQKNYVDAFQPWSYMFENAPKRTKNIYLHAFDQLNKINEDLSMLFVHTKVHRNSLLFAGLCLLHQQ